MEHLLQRPEIRVNDVNKYDVTALIEASKGRQKELVRLLLKHKDIDVNKVNWETTRTALFYACDVLDNANVISLFLRCPKTDIKLLDENLESAHQVARDVSSNYNFLFSNQSNLIASGHSCCSEEMKRGLQIAAKDDNEEYTKALLKCTGMDVNNGFASGFTPLFIASRENNPKIVAVLLTHPYINVNKIVGGQSPLIVSAEQGYLKIVKMLLNHNDIDTNINKRGNQGSALFLAATKGLTDITKELLLQPQIEVNVAYGPKEMTPLISASSKGNLEVVKLLLQCPKTDINATDAFGVTAFEMLTNETRETVNLHGQLLESNYTCCLDASRTLMQMAKVGDQRAVRGLAQCPNGNINMEDNKGRTPLYHATLGGHISVVHELLSVTEIIDVNRGRRLDGMTPFSIASQKGHFEMLRMFVLHENIHVNEEWLGERWTAQVHVSSFDANNDGYGSKWNGVSSTNGKLFGTKRL